MHFFRSESANQDEGQNTCTQYGRTQIRLVKKFQFFAANAALALLIGSTAAPIQVAFGYSIVAIVNRSTYSLHHVFVSPTQSEQWQDDELRSHVLQSGYSFTLPDSFFSAKYDIKLIDEDGDACIVPNVTISQDTAWIITDTWLLNCELHQ